MAKGLEGNVDEFSNSLERGSAKECLDGQAEKKDGKGQAVGENLLGNTNQMVTESTSITSGINNEKVCMAHGSEAETTKGVPAQRVPLQECTNLMPCSSGVTSVSQNKNLKGQWKRRARMSQAVSREGAAVLLDGLEGERLKRERDDMQLNTQAGLEMQQTKKRETWT